MIFTKRHSWDFFKRSSSYIIFFIRIEKRGDEAMYDKLKSLRWYIIYDWSVKAAFEWFLMGDGE